MSKQNQAYQLYRTMGYELYEEQPARGILVMRRGDEYVSIKKSGAVLAGNLLEAA